MTTFSPKDHYLKHESKACEAFRAVHASEFMSVTLNYALSQLSWLGATTEQLDGAKRYINLLMTIHEPEEKVVRRMPVIELASNEPVEDK